jgi:hypothetical protein
MKTDERRISTREFTAIPTTEERAINSMRTT